MVLIMKLNVLLDCIRVQHLQDWRKLYENGSIQRRKKEPRKNKPSIAVHARPPRFWRKKKGCFITPRLFQRPHYEQIGGDGDYIAATTSRDKTVLNDLSATFDSPFLRCVFNTKLDEEQEDIESPPWPTLTCTTFLGLFFFDSFLPCCIIAVLVTFSSVLQTLDPCPV